MSLGTVDSGGVWVADLIYVFDEDLNIYWMSHPKVRHSKALLENIKAAGSITVTSRSGENNLGIQFEGIASVIEGARHDLAVRHFEKRNKPAPKETDDVLHGASWYMVRPSKIQLIDEENFGFSKQTLEL
jgi:uncharacterized protein YhbP (UPF0306 family)